MTEINPMTADSVVAGPVMPPPPDLGLLANLVLGLARHEKRELARLLWRRGVKLDFPEISNEPSRTS